MKIIKKIFIILSALILFMAIFVYVYLNFFDDDWSLEPVEYDLNISLQDNKISAIDTQLRDMPYLKSKDVYLNDIIIETDACKRDIFNTNIEIIYVSVFGKVKGENKFKRYTFDIDLSNGIINNMTIDGDSWSSGIEMDIKLDDRCVRFEDYIYKVMNNIEIESTYVNSGDEYKMRLRFSHWYGDDKAIVWAGNEKDEVIIE